MNEGHRVWVLRRVPPPHPQAKVLSSSSSHVPAWLCHLGQGHRSLGSSSEKWIRHGAQLFCKIRHGKVCLWNDANMLLLVSDQTQPPYLVPFCPLPSSYLSSEACATLLGSSDTLSLFFIETLLLDRKQRIPLHLTNRALVVLENSVADVGPAL